MSVRERVEEQWTKLILERQFPGIMLSFSYGEPQLRRAGDQAVLKSHFYYDAKELAQALYESLLQGVDFNRLSIEVLSAHMARGGDYDDFGSDPKASGEAIKAALTTRDTFPDYAWKDKL